MDRMEYAAGENQKVVLYISDDTGGPVEWEELFTAFTAEAARWEAKGWRVVATSVLPLRQTGTAGNILFQSGGQYATKAALSVVYARS
jgi:hypothetical protein